MLTRIIFQPLTLGDKLTIECYVGNRIGKTSVTFSYTLFRAEELVGKAETTHVCLNKKARSKQDIPSNFREKLEKYLKNFLKSKVINALQFF